MPFTSAPPISRLSPAGRTSACTCLVLSEERYLRQRQPAGVVAALGRRGVEVSVVDPDALVHDLRDRPWIAGAAVVLARGRSPSLLTALAVAERFGVSTINRAAAVAAVRDKAAMAAALVAAGIPTPDTWVGRPAELSGAIRPASYPLVLKPVFGDNGTGVRLVGEPRELLSAPWPQDVALAQRYVPNGGMDAKVYAVGPRRWAVRVPSPVFGGPGGAADPEPVPVTPALADLADRCGRLFGLDLFGVDCLMTPGGPVAVEVNDFPNYRGVPDADEALAAYVVAAVEAS
jgi:ribosomal protein S6--L-glutamate ligase